MSRRYLNRENSSKLLILVAFLLFTLGATPSFGEVLSGLKWESFSDSFQITISSDQAIRFSISDQVKNDKYFKVVLYGIDRPYQDKTLVTNDPRLRQLAIRYDTGGKRVNLYLYPGNGMEWDVKPGAELSEILVIVHGNKPSYLKETRIQAIGDSVANSPGNHNEARGADPSGHNGRSFSTQGGRSYSPEGSGKSKRLVIIDPGHGGFNKGGNTFWPIKGKHYYEKSLTMKYASKLKYLIDQSPNLEAIMTRNDDVYVSLGDRVKYAQDREGDLFVSIHLNAAPNRRSATARGVEFFHWNEKGSDNAAVSYLEKLENDEMLPKLPSTENRNLKSVLEGLLKDALEEEKVRSRHLCESMWESFRKSPYFLKYHRQPPVKSARFVVLANYAMPSILIEVGFLTHKTEGGYLISESFQWTTARLMYNGIQKFFAQEDSTFKPHYVKF